MREKIREENYQLSNLEPFPRTQSMSQGSGVRGGGGGEGRESIAFQSDWQISECLSGLRRQRLEFPDSCCSGPGTEARK